MLTDNIFPSILMYAIFNLVGLLDEKAVTNISVNVLTRIAGNAGMLSLVGSRMLIRLKQAAEQNPREGGSLRIPTHASTDVFRTISTRPESVPGQSQVCDPSVA
ncbi:hypothetical protein ACEPAI_2148 [Sanghuangporus weigelae]